MSEIVRHAISLNVEALDYFGTCGKVNYRDILKKLLVMERTDGCIVFVSWMMHRDNASLAGG